MSPLQLPGGQELGAIALIALVLFAIAYVLYRFFQGFYGS